MPLKLTETLQKKIYEDDLAHPDFIATLMNKTCLTIEKHISEVAKSNIDFAEYILEFEACFQKCALVFNENNRDDRSDETTDLLDIFGDSKMKIGFRETLNEKEKFALLLMYQLIGNLGYCYSEEGNYDKAKLYFDVVQADLTKPEPKPKPCCLVSKKLSSTIFS